MRKEKKMKIREYLDRENYLDTSMVLEFADKVFGDLSEMVKKVETPYVAQIREDLGKIRRRLHFEIVDNPFVIKRDFVIEVHNDFVYKARKLIREAGIEYDLNSVEITAYYEDGLF